MLKEDNLDVLFCMASKGNKSSYNELFEDFLELGKIISISIIHSFGLSKFAKPDDFYDSICELFIVAINTFDPKINKFGIYSRHILTKRLIRLAKELAEERNLNVLSLDQVDNDNRPIIESIEDKSIHPIPAQISVDSVFDQIFDKRCKNRSFESYIYKINQLVYAGYSHKEIQKMLKLSDGEYKYVIKLLRSNKELNKIKLELK